VGDGIVTVREGGVQSLSLDNGQVLWEVADEAGRAVNGGKRIPGEIDFWRGCLGVNSNGDLVLGSKRGVVRLVEASSGKVKAFATTWSHWLWGAGTRVYGSLRDKQGAPGQLGMLDNSSLEPIGDLSGVTEFCDPNICVVGERAFGAGNTKLTCIDTATGTRLWESKYHERSPMVKLACDGKALYLGLEGRVAAYSATDGKRLWEVRERGRLYEAGRGLVASPSYVYVLLMDSRIQILDKLTGKEVYRGEPLEEVPASLTISSGRLYAMCERSLLCFAGA
jgi:outer membrane protein assembly factor BamB